MAKYANVHPKRNPTAHRSAVQRVATLALNAHDDDVEFGKIWYPEVGSTGRRQSLDLGISERHGLGIVAAVSPNMDFDAHNINALDQIGNLGKSEWDIIHASAGQKGRTQEARDMLRETAPSLSRAPDHALVKAHKILTGADPEDVLLRKQAPKTNSFFRNLHSPDDDSQVTIDGRQADIIANRMRPWEENRGISSAGSSRGTTRYEDHEMVMRKAASAVSKADPSRFGHMNAVQLQAVTWLAGKRHERALTGRNGIPGSQGPKRAGQPYL